jgi:ABC-type nitrate/sulfonate/bicarbonate transport system permease component
VSPTAKVAVARVGVLVGFLATWELFGRLVDPTWTSQPSLVATQLAELAHDGLAWHIAVTLAEMAIGLAIGVPTGIVLGIWLGRSPLPASLLRPFIVALNSVPVVALAPLLIMWFGLGMEPKIALVTLVSFLLLFFNTFAGAQAVDRDWIATLELMGATRREQFRKAVAPACVAWIFAGLKNALPYALIAATIGEMMVSRAGLGFLITSSSAIFDMTALYAVLVVLMLLGAGINLATEHSEAFLLRWRPAQSEGR